MSIPELQHNDATTSIDMDRLIVLVYELYCTHQDNRIKRIAKSLYTLLCIDRYAKK